MWDAAYPYLAALLPTIGILALFTLVIRNVLAADRQERKAQAQWQAKQTATDVASTSDQHGRPVGGPNNVGAGVADSGGPGTREEGIVSPAEVTSSPTTAQHRSEPDVTGHDKRR